MKRRWKVALGLLGVLALLLALLLVNAFVTSRDTKPAKADVGHVLDLPGGALQVREDGKRAGPAIVLIHCWAGSMHWWDRVTPLLGRNRRVVRVDLLGHGGSSEPRGGYSMEAQADRIAFALRVLKVKTALVAGHSAGGEVAIALGARHPELVRRLVVIDTKADEDDVSTDFIARLSVTPIIGQAFWQLASDGQVRDGLKQGFASDRYPVPEQFVRDVRRLTYSSFKKTYDESGDYVDDGNLANDFKRARAPAMVVFGRQDRLVDPASGGGGIYADAASSVGAIATSLLRLPASLPRLIRRSPAAHAEL